MSITVATVVLNAADELPATLESIIQQDFADLEVLVVDGSSSDGTVEVLDRYADAIDRLEIVEDAGVYDAMNRAALFASKDYVLFMNAGDRFHTERSLSKVWRRKHERADIVYGNHIYRAHGIDTFRPATDFGEHLRVLRSGDLTLPWLDRFPAHQATLTRTALLRRLGYDPAYRICADHDFLLRAVSSGARTQYVDEIVAVYSGGGLSARRHQLCRLEWNALYRMFSERPERVDRFFYGEASPFRGTPSAGSGAVISGLLPERAAPQEQMLPITEPFRWAGGHGFRLLSPADRAADGLQLRGYNILPQQTLDVVVRGTQVAQAALGTGSFDCAIAFDRPLAPGSLVDLVPQQATRLPGRTEWVSIAVVDYSFRFDEPLAPVPVGVELLFNQRNAHNVAAALTRGWWAPEPGHVWSKAACELRLSALDRVSAMTLRLGRNPAVGGQTLSISVNGVTACDHPLAQSGETVLPVPVAAAWRGSGAANHVRLGVSAAGTVGNDPRELGVALLGITLN